MEWFSKQYSKFIYVWRFASKRRKFCIFLAIYTFLFLFTFFLAYSPFILTGKSFIWDTDGRSEYYPALVYLGRYFRHLFLNFLHGDFSIPLFDISIGVGSDILVTLNYYGFGDPLNYLAIFVPTKYIEYLFNFLIVFRLYLAGLAFSAMSIYFGKRVAYTLIGVFVYVFSGYAIFEAVRFIEFINPMIQLPFLILGMDMIMQRKKPFIFIFAVAYTALCGFYFLYMMTIMLAFYGIIKFFDYYHINKIKEFVQMVIRIVTNYIIGIGLTAIFFVPSVIGFIYSSRSSEYILSNMFSYGLSWYITNLPKIIAPPASGNSLSLAAIVVFALIMLFLCPKRNSKLKYMTIVGLLIYILPLGGYAITGFGYASQRWTFCLALLFAYIVVEMLPVLLNLDNKQKISCFVVLVLYTTGLLILAKTRTVYYLVAIAMLAITLVVLLLVNEFVTYKKGIFSNAIKQKQFSKQSSNCLSWEWILCLLLVIANVSVNAVYKFADDQGKYINEFSKIGYETELIESAIEREAEPYLSNKDGRFDSSSFSVNVGMVWQVPTVLSYWNLTTSYISELWTQTENIKQYRTDFRLYGLDQHTILNALFSVKNFFEQEEQLLNIPYGYEFIEVTENGNYAYENKYALPWGYTYDSYITYDELNHMDGLHKEEAMLQSIALNDDLDNIPYGNIDSCITNVPYEIVKMKNIEWENGILEVQKANSVMTLQFLIPRDTEAYLRLSGFDINASGQSKFDVKVECNGVIKKAAIISYLYSWYWGKENYLFNLGYREDERITCNITFPDKGTYQLSDIQLYAMSMDKYPEQIEALRTESLENIKWDTNQISGTVNLSDNKILCMSIPYSKGWSAKVDGLTTEILRGNIMFMALPLEAGYHEIEFTYCTPGIRVGLVLSIFSVFILIYMYISSRKKVL